MSGSGNSLRIAFIDPHPFTRHCIADLMRSDGMQVVSLADVKEAAEKASGHPVDAVVLRLDAISVQDRRLLEDLRTLSEVWPRAPLVALAPLDAPEAGLEAAHLGLSGCLSPAMTASQVSAALRLVAAGGIFVGPSRAGGFQRNLTAPSPGKDAALNLTPRETEVLAMLRQGKPNKMIAFELDMAENTVKVHVGRILKKLGAANRTVVAKLDADAVGRRATQRHPIPRLQ